jgi:hypothetical protein
VEGLVVAVVAAAPQLLAELETPLARLHHKAITVVQILHQGLFWLAVAAVQMNRVIQMAKERGGMEQHLPFLGHL